MTAKQKAEHEGAMMNFKPTKRRRTSQDSCMNTSNHEDTTVENISDLATDENDTFNSATNYDDSVHDENDFEWERLSEFSSSDSETESEDSDWDP